MRPNLLSLLFLILLSLTLSACGSPRGDGIPWESTFPNVGDSITDVNKLYGKPFKQSRESNGDITNFYKNWRAKNQFNGLMHASDKHTVTFHDNKAIAWQ